MPETKNCSQHHTYFPTESSVLSTAVFGKKKASIDGLLDHCRSCKRAINARKKGNAARRSGLHPVTGVFLHYVGQLVDGKFRYTKSICAALGIPFEFGPVPAGLGETDPVFDNTSL